MIDAQWKLGDFKQCMSWTGRVTSSHDIFLSVSTEIKTGKSINLLLVGMVGIVSIGSCGGEDYVLRTPSLVTGYSNYLPFERLSGPLALNLTIGNLEIPT